MLTRLIELSLRHRIVVLILAAMLAVFGAVALIQTPKDALPDLSEIQVIVYSEFAEQAPQIVEAQVTYPLTTALRGVPRAKAVRGFSSIGSSFIYVIFEEGTDPYWARSRVLEYLNAASKRLPAGVTPTLGPDASGVGWVYQYALVDRSGNTDLSQLRSLQDWYLRYELQSISGVAEVAGIGGFAKQYQIEIDPGRLAARGLSIKQVQEAVAASNNDVGGRVLEQSETEFMIRGLGYIRNIGDIENIVVASRGVPVRVMDIGRVVVGPEFRRGLADLNGEGEAVGGIVVMRSGYNATTVIKQVKARLDELKSGLPPGVEVHTVYDRSGVVERAVDTLSRQVLEEMAIVALVCLIFLLHVRSALVAVVTLPLGILFSFLMMRLQGVNASIMSLGGIAIAIGAMVDAAIVMIENTHKHLEREQGQKPRVTIILEAAREVGPALFFSLLIITVSFLPVFSLQEQEGKMFAPLAFTKTYAMAGAALLSVTLVPVLMFYFVRGRIVGEAANPINRLLIGIYRPVLELALRSKPLTLLIGLVLVVATVWPYQRLGGEFMPALDEGDLLYMPTTFPEISITKVKQILQQSDRIIREFPEVKTVFGKAGRADTATDPAPIMMLETTIQLKPKGEWRPGVTQKKLIEAMDAALHLPGIANTWTMPIKGRIDMLSTGIKSALGVKVAGPDVVMLERIAKQVESIVKGVPEAVNVYAERAASGKFVDIAIDRVALSRYGLRVGDVEDTLLAAVGGKTVTTTVEGLERYSVNVRYPRADRDSVEALSRILISLPEGGSVPLQQVATIRVAEGPASIRSENARPNAWVYIDIANSDTGTFVARANEALKAQLRLPPGYSIAWSGQFEAMERAADRLKLIVPLTIAIIFLLLYFTFRDITRPLIIMLSLPLALAGGVWAIYLLDYQLSVAVGVGFIALAGVAAETGVLMLIYLDLAYRDMLLRHGSPLSFEHLREAILRGAADRLRPKLMTVSAIIAGLFPIMWVSGTGSEVMRRIAAPMIGGMISSTLLTLFVIPAVYMGYLQRRHVHANNLGNGTLAPE